MNLAETWWINSSFRVRALRTRVVERLAAHLDSLEGDRVLEVGCGQGVGVELLLDRFGAGDVVAIDLDPRMVRRARRRLRHRADPLEVRVGDACAITEPDGSFDAVVELSAIHHVPNWKDALAEMARVLRPGGRFIFEDHDVTRHTRISKLLFHHPAERFTACEFVEALDSFGIEVGDNLTDWNGYFVGVGRKVA